ncbi:MAG: LysR family transcriptional regulator [Actinomycetia bacterium]|nr:LysR family transcriptional regulator [Actinomycetes bacterium]
MARQALTEKEFRRRYIDRHQSLYDIAKQTGFSRQPLTRLATEYGIALRDLAREKNMSTANMARWAHLHQIPLRPRGAGATTQPCAC